MARSEGVMRRQSSQTRFRNADMDFALNWALGVSQIIGMSPGEVLAAILTVRDGDALGWVEAFGRQGEFLSLRADALEREGRTRAAGESAFGAAYARRFALHFVHPLSHVWRTTVSDMEAEFARAVRCQGVPLRPIDVPFDHGTLPGYHLEAPGGPRPTLLMIGGGDTFREDLFYFGGYPGWQRGYNALMVDLPGQGTTPSSGFTFRHNAAPAVSACIDWLDRHAARRDPSVILYGLSGGGYLTAQAVAADPRVSAWIASTPITDVATVFDREIGAMAKMPGWLMATLTRVLRRTDRILDVSLSKYAWQFGATDFAEVVSRVRCEAHPVDSEAISTPCLFLVGDGEAAELKRQTEELTAVMRRRGHDVTLRRFGREEGDAHCQVTNLALAHRVVFDWLDQRFGTSDDSALR